MKKKPDISKKQPVWFDQKTGYILICILVVILYGNSVMNGYSLDDNFVTDNNEIVARGISAIPEILTTHYSSGTQFKYEYRPIVKVSFAIEQELFGANPHISHFINLLLYLLTCIVLFRTLQKLLKNYHPYFPFFVIIIFIAHPIHTEVVTSLKNRDELLSFLFSILTLRSVMQYAGKPGISSLASSIVFFILAVMSKASALVFAALIPLILYFFTETSIKRIFNIFFILLIVFLLVRYLPNLFLPPGYRDKEFFENPLLFESTLSTRLGIAFYSLLIYLKLMFFPHPLLFYYGFEKIPIVGLTNPLVIISVLIHAALFIYAVIRIKDKSVISFGILFYLLSISMFSNILKPVMGIVGERYLFTGVLGFGLILVWFLYKFSGRDPYDKSLRLSQLSRVIIIIIVILIPYSVKTISRNRDWNDRLTLYLSDIKYLEKSAKANTITATTLIQEAYKTDDNQKQREYVNLAVKYFRQALEIYPEHSNTWNNLGSTYYIFFKQYDKAMECFRKAVEIKPDYAEAYFNMANYYELTGNLAKAKEYYQKTIESDPFYVRGYSNLGDVFYREGNLDDAIEINKRLLKIKPDSDVPYTNIGNYYIMQGDTATAIGYFEDAFRVNPDYYPLVINLARYFQQVKDFRKAGFYMNHARELEKKQGRER